MHSCMQIVCAFLVAWLYANSNATCMEIQSNSLATIILQLAICLNCKLSCMHLDHSCVYDALTVRQVCGRVTRIGITEFEMAWQRSSISHLMHANFAFVILTKTFSCAISVSFVFVCILYTIRNPCFRWQILSDIQCNSLYIYVHNNVRHNILMLWLILLWT